MFDEDDMEEVIISNLEKYLGEKGLKLISRQFHIGKYIFDLLLEDRHGGKLIVELQKGTLDRGHTYKILDYYDEYREAHPGEFIDLMVIANNIPSERKKRLSSFGIAFKEIPASEFIKDLVQVESIKEVVPHPSEKTSNQQETNDVLFDLYKRQKNEFIKVLKASDPTLIFKFDKDPKDVETFLRNPFFWFYPAVWEISPRQLSGVHICFVVRTEDAYARLNVGVESPIRKEYKEKFKREVVEELKRCKVELSEFDIWPDAGQTTKKTKLLEVRFPFDNNTWQKAIGYYKKMEALIPIVSKKIEEFKKNGYVK